MRDPILWTIILSLAISQGIKILLYAKQNGLSWKDFVVTGGMPSSHSSLVTGMTLILFLLYGPSSVFYVMLVVAMIVIRDALGVRRTAGEEGKVLNKLLKKIGMKLPKIHFALGHNPIEVFVGMLIGIGSAYFVYMAI